MFKNVDKFAKLLGILHSWVIYSDSWGIISLWLWNYVFKTCWVQGKVTHRATLFPTIYTLIAFRLTSKHISATCK